MADEYPSQGYNPSAKVRLIVRFDEYGEESKLASKAPKKSTKNLNGLATDRGNLKVIDDPEAPQGVRRLLIGGKARGTDTAPGSQEKSEDGLTHILGGIIPKEMSWKQNGIRTADSCAITIKYIDCPIDPRVIRACAVEMYLGTVSDDDHAAGIEGQTRVNQRGGEGSVEPMNMVPDSYMDENGTERTNLRFQGWVDKWVIDWTGEQEPVIRLECTDNTRLLFEQEMPPKSAVDMKKELDKAIADFLAQFPQMNGMSVEYRGSVFGVRGIVLVDKPPKLEESLSKTAFRPNLGPIPSKGAGSGGKHSIWDYLTDVCRSIGHAIFVEGNVVVIQRARTLYTNTAEGSRDSDPFKGRTVSGNRFNYRRFIYGRNISDLRMTRNYSKNTPTNVEIRSYSTKDKKVLVERFPQSGKEATSATPGDGGAEKKWLVLNISGIGDSKALRAVAQEIYESIGRNELQVEIKTKNIASFGGGNGDPDLLDMKPGDTIEVLVAREEDEYNTLTRAEQGLTAFGRNVEFMRALGFSREFAFAYANVYTSSNFQTVFRLKQIQTDWSIDDGVQFSIVAVNYIEVRADKTLPADEEPKAT